MEPRKWMLMWSRKRQSTAEGLTPTSSPQKTQQVGPNASLSDHHHPNHHHHHQQSTVSELLSYQIMGTKETEWKQRGRDGRSQGSACCERLAVSTHTKYPSQQSHCCVCVIQSLFCIRPKAGWRKVPVHRATGCCYCFLVSKASWDW